MIDDDALVTAALRGDEGSFRELVERHRATLHTLACGMLQDRDQAADAVQDAFLKAYGSLSDYRGRNQFRAWMRRILVNHCLSLLRQRHQYLSLEDLEYEPVSRERTPEEMAVAQNEADGIRRALGRLPAHHRAALVLRVIEGLSYREIAQLLQVSDSTVETWIHRGRLRMRSMLLQDPDGAPIGRDRGPARSHPLSRLREARK